MLGFNDDCRPCMRNKSARFQFENIVIQERQPFKQGKVWSLSSARISSLQVTESSWRDRQKGKTIDQPNV